MHPRLYTEEEKEIIKKLFDKNDKKNSVQKIIDVMPHRGRRSILDQAIALGISGNNHWTEDENKVIRGNFNIDNKVGSAKKIAKILGNRTSKAVLKQAIALGISTPTARWTEEEDETLRRHFDASNSVEAAKYIHKNYLSNRTIYAIRHRAHALGLTKLVREILWTQDEINILHQYAESTPLSVIIQKLSVLWDSKGLNYRSKNSVRQCLHRLNYSTRFEGDWFTMEQVSKGLGCSRKHARVLYERYQEVLQPQKIDSYNVVSAQNLKRFITRYPGEVAKLNPDIIWMIGVLTPDAQISPNSKLRRTKEEWGVTA